jgi:hypothetical protein
MGSLGPARYPTEEQAPYPDANEPYRSDQQYPYPPSESSFSRSDTSFSQNSIKKNRIVDYRPPPRQARAILEKAPAQETEYMGMLLHQSQVIEKRPYWNILAAASTWILLAGFIVLPGSFNKIQKSTENSDQSNFANHFVASILAKGLLGIASVLCGIGVLAITGLWLRWRANYIWLINKVLL